MKDGEKLENLRRQSVEEVYRLSVPEAGILVVLLRIPASAGTRMNDRLEERNQFPTAASTYCRVRPLQGPSVPLQTDPTPSTYTEVASGPGIALHGGLFVVPDCGGSWIDSFR